MEERSSDYCSSTRFGWAVGCKVAVYSVSESINRPKNKKNDREPANNNKSWAKIKDIVGRSYVENKNSEKI